MSKLNFRDFFRNGGEKTSNPPKWSQNINVDSYTSGGYPAWWLSTQKMSTERKQQHFNAIVNHMLDDGYELTDIPMVMNGIIGYGEDERDRQEFIPTLGFDKGDINNLLKNYNPNNFKNGGEFNNGGKYLDKKQYAYQYFLNKGYKPHESAAIVGNLMQESNLNDKIAKDFQGRNAFGIAQWTDKSRRQNLFSRYGENPTFEQQLEHVDYELNTTHKGALSKLKNSKNVDEATLAISKHYEIPSERYAHNDKRVNYARSILGMPTSSIGGGLGKYFNQIEQDLSWRSRQIDEELENEEIHQYSQEEAIANNTEEEDEETATEEQPQVTQDEYVPLNELSKLMTASRRNDFLDIVFANTAPSIEENQYQYYA